MKELKEIRFNETNIQLKDNLVKGSILPEKIAEYILFEGETISKYKKLLDRNRNNEIYASIREILGLKVLGRRLPTLKKPVSENRKILKYSLSSETIVTILKEPSS